MTSDFSDKSTDKPAATSSTMETIKDEAKSRASDLKENVKEEVSRREESVRSGLAERVESFSDALRAAKSELSDDSPVARIFDYAADNAHGLSRTLESRDTGEMADQLRDFARERPAAFLGIAAIAGFAAARFLLAGSTSDDGYRSGSRDHRARSNMHGSSGGRTGGDRDVMGSYSAARGSAPTTSGSTAYAGSEIGGSRDA